MTLDRVTTSLDPRLRLIAELAAEVRGANAETQRARALLVYRLRDAYGPYTLQQLGDAAGLSRERVRQLLKED